MTDGCSREWSAGHRRPLERTVFRDGPPPHSAGLVAMQARILLSFVDASSPRPPGTERSVSMAFHTLVHSVRTTARPRGRRPRAPRCERCPDPVDDGSRQGLPVCSLLRRPHHRRTEGPGFAAGRSGAGAQARLAGGHERPRADPGRRSRREVQLEHFGRSSGS